MPALSSPDESHTDDATKRARKKPMATYNVFRSKRLVELCCAVPEWCVVPGFLRKGGWTFDGTLETNKAPGGFDPVAARTGVRFNGFHLFLPLC